MMKSEFKKCAEALRKYWTWEEELYQKLINLAGTPAGGLADFLLDLLENQDGAKGEWSYDPIIEMSWVVTWCSASPNEFGFARKGQWVYLPDAGALWVFVSEMRELGWPEQVENQRWLR